jgi:hypothetical protein
MALEINTYRQVMMEWRIRLVCLNLRLTSMAPAFGNRRREDGLIAACLSSQPGHYIVWDYAQHQRSS